MNSYNLSWKGPYSLVPRDGSTPVYKVTDADMSGVYLWTVPVDDQYLINYVGIGKYSVATRQVTHVSNYLAGKYVIYEPGNFTKGLKEIIYRPEDGFDSYLERYSSLSEILFNFLRCIEIFVAPVQADGIELEYIETAIIQKLRNNENKYVTSFLDNSRVSRRLLTGHSLKITMDSEIAFAGLPSEINIED